MQTGFGKLKPDERAFRRICVVLFFLVWGATSYMHQRHFDAPTPVSRLDTLYSLLYHGTLNIDAYQTNTPDKAFVASHFYSDKAPGTTLAALPAFALTVFAANAAEISMDTGPGWLAASWISCVFSLGLITACGAVAMFAWLSRFVTLEAALITSLALFLGAAPLPYATMLFSHSLVVALLAIALYLLDVGSPAGEQRRRVLKDVSAGVACGYALASEFTAGLTVVGITVWLVCKDWKRALKFSIAASVPLLLIPAYSFACYGDPLTLPYTHQSEFPEMREGFFSVKGPNPQVFMALLFHPARGLLFWSPFLLLAINGFWGLWKAKQNLFWMCYLVAVTHLIVLSGRVWDWPAGPTLGPRYLAPLLPFLALPCALAVSRCRTLGQILAAISIIITTFATLIDACPYFREHPFPLFDLHLPLFLRGEISPNLGTVVGLHPYASMALYYALLFIGITVAERWSRCRAPEEALVVSRAMAVAS